MYSYGYANKRERERERGKRVNSWDAVGALVDGGCVKDPELGATKENKRRNIRGNVEN